MSQRNHSSETSADRDTLRSLPPSAKLVAKTLEYEGDLTQGRLADRTMLPSRTVRYALGELEDNGLVDSRIHIQDARQRVYSLAPSLAADVDPDGARGDTGGSEAPEERAAEEVGAVGPTR